jgi:exodeoxyribonuclease V gamma subunit
VLHIHRAERADRLADALADILAAPPEDPFTPDVVSVPTRGMERWLVQRLSGRLGARPESRDGVCANVDFPFPGRLIGGALALASGIEPDADPWQPDRLVWPLLELIDSLRDEAWLAPLIWHLDSAPDRRFGRVRQIAGLFDEYGVRRPAMLQAWAAGQDGPDGGGWQPELWRCLRDAIGVPSGAERLPEACRRLRDDPALVELPARLGLFGLTRLPPGYVQALHALAAGRDVHLFLLHPSPVLWDRVRDAVDGNGTALARHRDPSARLAANRLLASWGRDSRELQLVLASGPAHDHHLAVDDAEPITLLGRLQADIRADRAAPGVPLPGASEVRMQLSGDDDSIAIHACHGRPRQVEVLREAILHLLESDPTLEPRDVIVMCPDVETFAPLIQAAFGAGPGVREEEAAEAGGVDGESRIDLRVRLADRSLRQTNPVLSVIARLLELPAQRLTASEVLDLADAEPVRRRFDFDDDELARLGDWVSTAAIHWGLDAEHRRPFKLDGVEAGTWRSGLRRLLLGVTLSESGQRLYERVLPVDDVDSGSIDLAGRFAEFVDRLGTALESLSGTRPVSEWSASLRAAADGLAATRDWESWQRLELERILTDVEGESTAGTASALALPEIRALLGDRLAGRPTRANFRTGHLTVCTLVPMRSVPHRVVCLLGMDDGAFPRHASRDGDNRLLEDPHVGDRDPRSEDRQLLLDAFMAARERLLITYSGHDDRTNASLPPAVPVAELLDAIEASAQGDARERVLVHHPLQPFDRRNFVAGRLAGEKPWSFDAVSLEGAWALEAQRHEPPPFLAGPLPPVDPGTLALSDLISFVQRPVRAFLRQRLGVSIGITEDEIQDALPVELDNLQRWQIGQRLLEGLLAGIEPQRCLQAEIARGTLPPEALGAPVMTGIWEEVTPILAQARARVSETEPRPLETNLLLDDGPVPIRLTGTVSGVRGHVLLTVSFSRLGPRHRLAAWVNLLALSAAHPEIPFEALTVGRARGRQSGRAAVSHIPALGPNADQRRQRALSELDVLADLRLRGLREPLPLPCQTAAAYAAALIGGRADEGVALKAALAEWKSEFDYPKEDAEPEHKLAFGGQLTLEELTAFAPASDEYGDGWSADQASRFGRYALRLWRPLLLREVVE